MAQGSNPSPVTKACRVISGKSLTTPELSFPLLQNGAGPPRWQSCATVCPFYGVSSGRTLMEGSPLGLGWGPHAGRQHNPLYNPPGKWHLIQPRRGGDGFLEEVTSALGCVA